MPEPEPEPGSGPGPEPQLPLPAEVFGMTDFEHERLDVYRAAIAWLIIADEKLGLGPGLGLGIVMYLEELACSRL